MGTGQTLLVLAALVILAIITISANKLVLSQSDTVLGSEAMITGTAIAQAKIEEATVKYFDGNVLPPLSTDTVSMFTPPPLGPSEPGVIPGDPSTYVSLSDYNGYVDTVSTPRLGDFITRDSVYYVNENPPYSNVETQTFFKRIDVIVQNKYLPGPYHADTLSAIVSYRYKS